MKISYFWLKEFLSLSFSAQDIAEKLTQVGLEVENITSFRPHLDQKRLVVGTVQQTKPMPTSKTHLWVEVSVGNHKKPLHIVCGAGALTIGERACVALVGAVLRNFDGKNTHNTSQNILQHTF